MWRKSRNGTRKLNRSLDLRCWRYATRMLNGACRPDYFALAIRALNQALRIHTRLAKEEPHVFGPHSRQYLLDTFQMEREEQEREAALRKVYGPPKPGEPVWFSTVWSDRYNPPEDRKGRRMFFKWFHEKYPPK